VKLDPARRRLTYTGKSATLLATGETFEEIEELGAATLSDQI
jgi:hypothetical protein